MFRVFGLLGFPRTSRFFGGGGVVLSGFEHIHRSIMLGSYDALDAGKRTDEDTDNSEEAADAQDRLQSEPDHSEEAELPSGLEWRLAEQAKGHTDPVVQDQM